MSECLINLAHRDYNYDADKEVKNELLIANIPVFKLPGYMNTEVKTRYIGLLNGFVFDRAWTYWVCCGDMPLNESQYIYDNYKKLKIRAGGHCGNVEPATVSYNPVYEQELCNLLDKYDVPEYLERAKNIVDDKALPRFVDTYHIDTQLGLCKLAQVIREHNITCELKHLTEQR